MIIGLSTLTPLLAAIALVESGGNPAAVGDHGRAFGLYQIHAGVVTDVNRHFGTTWRHVEVMDPNIAAKVARAYLEYYGALYLARTGQAPTLEVYARIWNGGPNGWRRSSTLPYWHKVRGALASGGSQPQQKEVSRE